MRRTTRIVCLMHELGDKGIFVFKLKSSLFIFRLRYTFDPIVSRYYLTDSLVYDCFIFVFFLPFSLFENRIN